MKARMKLALAGCFLWLGCSAGPDVGAMQSALKGGNGHGHGHGHDKVERVLLLSIDGMHDFDLTNYVAAHPTSALASLVARGTVYTQAYSTVPSDSFPATLAITTGGSPKSTGVYYDTSWDDNLSPPGSNCSTRGTVVAYKENLNFTSTGSTVADINPATLPRDPDNGCAPVYPHSYLKVNTIYEVIHNAGLRTAVCDKHPSYELLSGPSGTGLDDFYGPEFNSAKKDIAKIIANDELKVVAVLNQINGLDHTGTTNVGVPAIFGMNFQAWNIAQKFSGFLDAANTMPDTVAFIGGNAGKAPGMAQAEDYVDGAVGRMLAELDANGLTDSTLIVMAAKHGNSPIDRNAFVPIDPDATFKPMIDAQFGAGTTAQVTADTMALIWLTDHSKADDVASFLRANSATLGGGHVYAGHEIDLLGGGQMRGNPGRHPDIIVQPDLGVVYATLGSKLCDHGGMHEQDLHVAMVVAGPKVDHGTVHQRVSLQQVAPTILKALSLKDHDLQAVRMEHITRLPVADDDRCDD
jgi:hypothetical protein